MIDYIEIAILVVIVAAAAFYVYKAKKSGKKFNSAKKFRFLAYNI